MSAQIETTINTIIRSAYEVYNVLRSGFVEEVYKQSLSFELTLQNISNEVEKQIRVFYKGQEVGFYKADILAEKIIIECKCVSAINLKHIGQVKNYLKATGLQNALIINFGTNELVVKRVYG